MLAHGTLVPTAAALPAPIPGLPYAAIHTPAAHSDQSVLPPREIGRCSWSSRASYTRWNPRAEGSGPAALYPLQGAMVPFAATREARMAAGDPRPSIAERYEDDAAYVAAVRRAATAAVAERLLLPPDAEALVARAQAG